MKDTIIEVYFTVLVTLAFIIIGVIGWFFGTLICTDFWFFYEPMSVFEWIWFIIYFGFWSFLGLFVANVTTS